MSILAPSQRAAATLAVLLLLTPLSSSEEKRITFYSSAGTFGIAILEREQREYFRLLDVLEHFGAVNLKYAGQMVRIRQNEVESQFTLGQTGAKIGRLKLEMPAPALVEDGQVLLPVASTQTVLSQMMRTRVEFHEAGRRVFVGDSVQMATTEIQRGESSALVLSFPAPVNPTISTEGGHMRLVFPNEPVMLSAERITYQDKIFTSLSFTERNGAAEVAVVASAPLIASFSDGNRKITITVPPAAEVRKTQPAASALPPATSQPPIVIAPPTNEGVMTGPDYLATARGPAPNGVVPFFILIDAGHGGAETGARFSEKLAEKEVTLALARRLRMELQSKGVAAVLLRDGDTTLPLEERALAVNSQRAGIYVSIHVVYPGHGVRIYSALPSRDTRNQEEQVRMGPFLPWENAQSRFVSKSRALADALAAEFGNRKFDALAMSASVSPLNQIAAPAVAIEVALPDEGAKLDELMSPKYQTRVAQAAAAALVLGRIKLEEEK